MKQRLLYLILLIGSYSFAQLPSQGLVRGYDFTNGSTADLVGTEDLTLITPASATAATLVNDRFNTPNNAVKLTGVYTKQTILIMEEHFFQLTLTLIKMCIQL